MALDLARVRRQLRLDPDYTGEDGDLMAMVEEAKAFIERRCDRTFVADGEEPEGAEQMKMTADLERAVLMLVGHWYANREGAVVGVTSAAVELGVDRILHPHQRY